MLKLNACVCVNPIVGVLVTFFEADKRRRTRSRLIDFDVDVDEKKGRSDQINEMKMYFD